MATSTQDRRYLRGDPECDQVACDSIRMNGERAIKTALITQAGSAHEPAMKALREAYTALAFAFNRLHGSARSRDTELCDDIGKVRARIETVFHDAGERL